MKKLEKKGTSMQICIICVYYLRVNNLLKDNNVKKKKKKAWAKFSGKWKTHKIKISDY